MLFFLHNRQPHTRDMCVHNLSVRLIVVFTIDGCWYSVKRSRSFFVRWSCCVDIIRQLVNVYLSSHSSCSCDVIPGESAWGKIHYMYGSKVTSSSTCFAFSVFWPHSFGAVEYCADVVTRPRNKSFISVELNNIAIWSTLRTSVKYIVQYCMFVGWDITHFVGVFWRFSTNTSSLRQLV